MYDLLFDFLYEQSLTRHLHKYVSTNRNRIILNYNIVDIIDYCFH